jgi:hypothetical protein
LSLVPGSVKTACNNSWYTPAVPSNDLPMRRAFVIFLILLFPLNVLALSMSVSSMQSGAVHSLSVSGDAAVDATDAPGIQAMGDPDSDEPPAGYDFHDSVNEEGRLQPAALAGRSRPALLPAQRGLAPFPPIKPPPVH